MLRGEKGLLWKATLGISVRFSQINNFSLFDARSSVLECNEFESIFMHKRNKNDVVFSTCEKID